MEFCNILLDPHWVSEKLVEPDNVFELLSLAGFSDFRPVDTRQPLLRFRGEARNRIERLITEMLAEQEAREPGFETALKAQAHLLLCYVFRQMAAHGQAPGALGPDFLQYLRQHCAEKLPLEELAKSCFYNPSYFSRRFKEQFGTTITDFIQASRLEKARELLDSNLSIDEIIRESGFGSKNAFYRLFREQNGLTPGQYRQQLKLAKAKELLYTTNMSIAEISSRLNFECIGQFSTFFKKKTGVSPLEFRKRGTKKI
jgi:AraC-like DNA-binding protein